MRGVSAEGGQQKEARKLAEGGKLLKMGSQELRFCPRGYFFMENSNLTSRRARNLKIIPTITKIGRAMAHGYNGSHGPWLQWVPWPMVTMGPEAHGYNGSHGPRLQWVPWPMVTIGPMAPYSYIGGLCGAGGL